MEKLVLGQIIVTKNGCIGEIVEVDSEMSSIGYFREKKTRARKVVSTEEILKVIK